MDIPCAMKKHEKSWEYCWSCILRKSPRHKNCLSEMQKITLELLWCFWLVWNSIRWDIGKSYKGIKCTFISNVRYTTIITLFERSKIITWYKRGNIFTENNILVSFIPFLLVRPYFLEDISRICVKTTFINAYRYFQFSAPCC